MQVLNWSPSRRFVRAPGWLGGLCVALLLFSGAKVLGAQEAPAKEYQLKAVFLFNFAQFTDWPAEAFGEVQAPFVIGVLGEDPFGDFLDETVRGEKVNNHSLVVQRFQRVEDIKNCQILFINKAQAARPEAIIASLKGRNILMVSDADNFAQHGGMIQFATEKNKIRLKINTAPVKAAGLTISSKLLKLADLVSASEN